MLKCYKISCCITSCPDGGTGRRVGLKIRFFHESEGSTPSPGTKKWRLMNINKSKSLKLIFKQSCTVQDCGKIFALALIFLLSANINIPFYPVPFTLQTLIIPLICLFICSSTKQIFCGLAIFSIARTFQCSTILPITTGYIFGFFVMAGILTNKNVKENIYRLISGVLVSQIIVLFLGSLFLALHLRSMKAFQYGFLFFIPGEFLKLFIIVVVSRLLKNDFSKTKTER